MTEPFAWVRHELDALGREELRRDRRVVTALPRGRCLVNGRTLRNFAANDYLDLAHDPRVVAAAQAALAAAGAGAGASALVCGRSPWHAALEEALERFEGLDGVVLFPTGYAANVGTITALAGPDDVIFSDRLNHASLIDGCRLSRARVRPFRHLELDQLERELPREAGARRRLIVTDSVFSMDGDLAPLPGLCELARRFDCLLIVDEAHATGILGEYGRGATELLEVESHPLIKVGTLSKALGSLGGFAAASRDVADWLWNRARTQMFSTALPPAACAAAQRALEIVVAEPARRTHLLALAERLRVAIARLGLQTMANGVAPIVPVLLDTPGRALRVAAALEARGFLVGAIRPPTVPRGTSRLRITLSAAFTAEDIDDLAAALELAAREAPT